MLEIGIRGSERDIVTHENSAAAMGSGELDVYATPAMCALMERAAYRSVAAHLDKGMGTVGTRLSIEHTSATPVGMGVRAESELVEIDGRRLVFTVAAYDEKGMIGKGSHERFIINNVKFQDKTDKKKEV